MVLVYFSHQCNKCLKKTNDSGEQIIAANFVLPDSACLAPGGGAHTWNSILLVGSNVTVCK
jgi:hypothetical protein